MKNYFKFNLTGNKLAPIFYLFYVTLLIPMCLLISMLIKQGEAIRSQQMNEEIAIEIITTCGIFALLMIFPIIIHSYFVNIKLIEGVEFQGKQVEFQGTFGTFLKKFFVGLLLSIITIGIYLPWFIKDMMQYFVGNTTVDQDRAKFNGNGLRLFLIITFALIIPSVILSMMDNGVNAFKHTLIFPALAIFIFCIRILVQAPFRFLIVKWYVDLEYKGFKVLLSADVWEGVGVVVIQSLLTLVSLGIYFPVAYLKIYKFFAERVTATSDEKTKIGGYELEPMEDFKFIWSNVLLIIVTLGIYYPWGYCNIMNRVASKTYIQEV
jgi:uncharacterized membrane protein YjgN (DUF898 family)